MKVLADDDPAGDWLGADEVGHGGAKGDGHHHAGGDKNLLNSFFFHGNQVSPHMRLFP